MSLNVITANPSPHLLLTVICSIELTVIAHIRAWDFHGLATISRRLRTGTIKSVRYTVLLAFAVFVWDLT